eukprot:11880758-Alexandrium_andersonii.AAC.1
MRRARAGRRDIMFRAARGRRAGISTLSLLSTMIRGWARLPRLRVTGPQVDRQGRSRPKLRERTSSRA